MRAHPADMAQPQASAPPPGSKPRWAHQVRAPLAVVTDIAAVLVFVMIGRRSHAEHDSLAGIATTAWPFLAGLALGWVSARTWRAPTSARRAGVVWVLTVVVGHALRLAAGQGSAWSFLVVTSVVLGLFLLGWRVVVTALVRRRSPDRRGARVQ